MSDLSYPPDEEQPTDPRDPEDDGEEQDDSAFSTMEGRVQQATQVAREVATRAIPPGVPASWAGIAHQELIQAILRDWSKNGTEELVEEDITNLTAFTRISAGAGTSAALELQDPTFVAVLRGLLEDWVANWSGDDEEGEEG